MAKEKLKKLFRRTPRQAATTPAPVQPTAPVEELWEDATPLRRAVIAGDLNSVLTELSTQNESPNQLNEETGETLLGIAVGRACSGINEFISKHIAMALLQNGADPNQGGIPLLHMAAGNDHQELVRLLINAKCPIDINATDENGHTAFFVAIQKKHPMTAEILLLAGADPNKQPNDWELTTALLSIQEGHESPRGAKALLHRALRNGMGLHYGMTEAAHRGYIDAHPKTDTKDSPYYALLKLKRDTQTGFLFRRKVLALRKEVENESLNAAMICIPTLMENPVAAEPAPEAPQRNAPRYTDPRFSLRATCKTLKGIIDQRLGLKADTPPAPLNIPHALQLRFMERLEAQRAKESGQQKTLNLPQ